MSNKGAVKMSDKIPADTVIEQAAKVMHDAYEAAAVREGWETQQRSRVAWEDVPEANRRTMYAALDALADAGLLRPAGRDWNERPRDFNPADRDEPDWQAIADQAEQDMAHWVRECGDAERRAERAQAEVARLTAQLGDCHCDLNPAGRDERGDRLEAMVEFMADREVQALELHGDEPGLQARRVCRTCHVSQPCPTQQALRTENTARYTSRVAELQATVARVRALVDEWEDDGPRCHQLRSAHRRLSAALDGGEQR